MVTKISSILLSIFLIFTIPQSFAAPVATQDKPMDIPARSTQSVQTQSFYSYNFGYWPVGSTAYYDFSFTSYGGSIIIYSISTYGGSFYSVDNCPYRLYGGYSCLIRVYFRPWGIGYQSGETYIHTSSGTSRIYLSGYGY